MKIAIATVEKNENSEISSQAGRAPYYLIFNEEGKIIETIANPFAQGGGGAGFGVAKMLADKGVNIVIAGSIGANMVGALEERGLEYAEQEGTAFDAARSRL